MTYAELAEKLGVSVETAQRRVFRARWERQPGNDGRARVAVPLRVLAEAAKPRSPVVAPDSRGGRLGEEEALSVLRLVARRLADQIEATRREHAETRAALARREGEEGAGAAALLGLVSQLEAAQAALEAERREHAETRAALARREGEEGAAAPALLRLGAQLEAAQAALEAERRDHAEARAIWARELAEAREALARQEGELEGLKIAAEHTHEHLAQARREAADARAAAQDAYRRVVEEETKSRELEAAMARLRERGLWARLRNRER